MDDAQDKERAENGAANAGVDTETPFEVAVALTGQGRFHVAALAVCGFCLMTLIFESLAAAYVTPAAQCDFEMSSFEKGFLSGTIYIGMIASSHLWGFVADTRGRRSVLLVTLAGNCVCSVVAAFMPSLPLLIFLRLLNGIFICGPSAVTYAYLGEFHGEKTRTQSMVHVCIFIALASVAQPGLAWVVIPQPWDVSVGALRLRSWRVFLLLGAALSGLTLLLLALLLPESPKFLLATGRTDDALDVLRHMFATNNGLPPEKFPVTALQKEQQSASPVGVDTKSPVAIARHMWRQTAPLFRPPYLLYTLLACLLQFGLYASSNGFLLWLPDLVSRMSQYNAVYPGHETTVCDVIAILAGQMAPPVDIQGNYSSVVNASAAEPWAGESAWELTTASSALLENSSALLENSSSLLENSSSLLENSSATALEACSVSMSSSSFQNTLIVGVGMAVSFASVTLLLKVVSKKVIIAVCLAVSGACGVSMIWAQTELQILLLPMAFIVLSGMCIAVVNSVVVDTFPTYLRAMAVCLSLCFGRLGTFLTSLMLGALIDSSCVLAIAILGGFVFGCGVLSMLLPSEAKMQKLSH